MGRELSDVVVTGPEGGEDGIVDGAFQWAPGEAVMSFGVATWLR